MMTSRAMELVVFVACAGTAGAWCLIDHDRLFELVLFLGLASLMWHTHSRRPAPEKEPESIERIRALFYAQGLQHGRARSERGDDALIPVKGD